MNVTIDIKTLLIAFVLIALIIMIVYTIMMIRKLLITLEHTNSILEDVEVVSSIASERSKDVDSIISNVSCSVSDLSDALKGNQGTVSAIASIVKSAASIKGMMSKDKND
ncbi:MAG: hypothetical protein PHS19_05625 [Eubacteriales bacterium]|nr:hypothetical protein [Eubacteriales bacterium]